MNIRILVFFLIIAGHKIVYGRHLARVVKLVDTLDLGSSALTGLGVRVPPLVPVLQDEDIESCERALI